LLPGAEARLVDDDGHELPPEQPGLIYCRHMSYPNFTYNNNEPARRAIDRDGLVAVGDVGYFDRDGYLFLCDRKTDMVISGGVNIYPAEIEAVLITMPGVADCAVFGIPDAEFGEALAAHIAPHPGIELSADQVRAFLRPHLADYKLPRVVAFADELPREETGKLLKRKLRDPYWRDAGRRI
jgi:long-chain acyl-CoA synthetase